ncbi:MAG: glycosyltransferase family 2 protein, partial [Candidatus Zixiibacteriota bacterium]
MSRILTIGMAVHNNPQGVWMTIESIREKYPQCAQDVQFLVLDNCPDSVEGEATRDYVRNNLDRSGDGWVGHYIAATPRQSTSLRNLIFDCAETEYVMCLDSHIFLKGPNALPKTIAFLKSGAAGNDLYHGPAYHERGYIYATHMNPAFRGQNFGTWGVMQAESGGHVFHADWPEPIEIPAHGMGLFLARRDTWLRFHHAFRHFGGEECYIHEKYRLHGRK